MASELWSRWEDVVSSKDADPLEVISLAGRLRRYLDAVESAAVKAARAQGASWQEIADAVGTTRQSAWEKWKEVRRLAESSPERFDAELSAIQRAASKEVLTAVVERGRRPSIPANGAKRPDRDQADRPG